jgi:hypothetical protein
MKKKLLPLSLLFLSLLSVQFASAQTTYTSTFQLKKSVVSTITDYIININVSETTYSYYKNANHKALTLSDFAKFVTPGPVKPIADLLWTIYNDSESYVNGVLMMIHQIQYVEEPPKYAIEYLVDMQGDCEVSYLAASLTIAGGLKTVLMFWKLNRTEGHVNIGVALPYPPKQARTSSIFYVTINNINYYIAECTGDKWETGWRVGELPKELEGLTPQIVSLESVSFDSPAGLVSASINVQQYESSITINSFLPLVSYIYISVTLTPNLPNQTINLYLVTQNSYKLLASTATDSNGNFKLTYIPLWITDVNYGSLAVSYNGNQNYKGTSYTLTFLNTFSTLIYMPFYYSLTLISLFIGAARR